MTTQHQVDLNQVGCLREIHRWGETAYQNICSGIITVVPWGSMDYLLGTVVVGFVSLLALTFIFALFALMDGR